MKRPRRPDPEEFLVLLPNGSHDKRRCGCGGCEDFRAKYRDEDYGESGLGEAE